jgi:Na+-transporting methylmalonyl-CoA/oxaloacetate decarboxylase gamma subunit
LNGDPQLLQISPPHSLLALIVLAVLWLAYRTTNSPINPLYWGVMVILSLIIIAVTAISFFKKDFHNEVVTETEQSPSEQSKTSSNQLGPNTNVTVELASRSEFKLRFNHLLQTYKPHHVDMSGLSLLTTIQSHRDCIEQLAKQGCHFRFLLIDPDSAAAISTVGLFEDHRNQPIDIQDDIRKSLDMLRKLIATGKIEVRFTPLAPAISQLNVKSDFYPNFVQVELFGYGVALSKRPHFVLYPENKPWYRHFQNQFEILWKNAQVWPECKHSRQSY